MTIWPVRNALVLVMSPDCTRRADAKKFAGLRVTPSCFSCSSAVGVRRRIAVLGMDWSYWQIRRATESPYSRAQRSTSHRGWARPLARASADEVLFCAEKSLFRGEISDSLRRTAFTKGA